MKGTSRQPEFRLELITHALGRQLPKARHLLLYNISSFPEKGVSQVSYFRTCSRTVKAIQLYTFHSLFASVDGRASLC